MRQFLLSSTLLLLAQPLQAASAERVIQASVPAAGIETLAVKAASGKLRIVAHDSDTLELNLKLTPERGKRPPMESVKLETEREGTTLRFSLDVPFNRDDIEEDWQIRAPARLAVKAKLGVGELVVEGLGGGLDLSVSAGEIHADSPRGAVRAHVGVGNIRVKSATDSYGTVELDADVGDTKLTVNGHRFVHAKPTGAGNRVALEGSGRDLIELKTGVGDAELEIASSRQ